MDTNVDEYRIPVRIPRVPVLLLMGVGVPLAALLVYLVPSVVATSGTVPGLLLALLFVVPAVAFSVSVERRRRARLLHPPVLNAEGIRVRAFGSPDYDLTIPWEQVRRIWLLRERTGFLMVEIRDVDAVTRDPLQAAKLRANAGRNGVEFWYSLDHSIVLSDRLAPVVDRLSGGRVRLG